SPIELNVRLSGNRAAAGRFAIDIAYGDGAVAQEFVLPQSLVQLLDFIDDFRGLVDGVVAFLRHRAVTTFAREGDSDLHPPALAAQDFAVGRVGHHHALRADLVFFDDV